MTIRAHRLLCFGAVLLLGASHLAGQGTGLSAKPAVNGPVHEPPPAREKVLILFAERERHIDRVVALRERIEREGGRVRAVLGLVGVIADVPPGSTLADAKSAGTQRVYRGMTVVAPQDDAETQTAIKVWNRLQAPAPLSAKAPRNAPPAGAPPTDAIEPSDLPADPVERRTIESSYAQHRRELRLGLPPSLQRAAKLGCGTNGAGYFDTSLYLAGDIAVGVFYVNGTSGGWTPSMTAQTFADVVASLDRFLDIQPNARLAFTYVTEVDGNGNPLPMPSNERDYVNDLRGAWCTDWAYLISVQNGGVWPNAYLHGPSVRLDRTWTFFDNVVRHETGHIFGAGDQYLTPGGSHPPTARYGYLMVTHGNGCDSDSLGYFSGAGECLPDLMSGWDPVFGYNSIIGPYTAGQFGWYDSDGNGVLDVSETKPAIDGVSVVHVVNPATRAVSYSGAAFDRPLLDELVSYGDVSINRITAVQYRIGSAPWQDAVPADGVFDSVSEGFQFTTPALPNGTYLLQIQAINTVGKQGPPFQESLVITGSPIANTRPFGSLSVTPERAKLGTTVTASGLYSRDLESYNQLQFSWNWGDGPSWTPFQSGRSKTHVYVSAGTFTVQMRVRDPGGLVHLVTRNVTVEAYDTAPIVAFVVTPENRHFTPGPSYSLDLSVADSRDGETPYSQLQVQWDANGDGVWDGPWTTAKTATVTLGSLHDPKSDWRRVRVHVRDNASPPNVTEAVRFIWVVPYNQRPSLGAVGVTFTPSGANYLATVSATDADPATWDGILEYRYDYDGDGSWDTRFEPNPTTTVTPDGRYSLRIEVQDRFHGRVSFSGWGGCNPICF